MRAAVRYALACVVLVCGQAVAAAAQVATSAPENPEFRHAASGMTFPERVGDFVRRDAQRYNAAGTDMSVGYALRAEGLSTIADVYIYPLAEEDGGDRTPAPPDPVAQAMLCSQELEKRKAELLEYHPGVVLGAAKPISLRQAGKLRDGYHIFFNDVAAYGGVPQNVSSDFYVFCFAKDQWTIAYRFTYPAKLPVAGLIDDFMRDLRWPDSSGAQSSKP